MYKHRQKKTRKDDTFERRRRRQRRRRPRHALLWRTQKLSRTRTPHAIEENQIECIIVVFKRRTRTTICSGSNNSADIIKTTTCLPTFGAAAPPAFRRRARDSRGSSGPSRGRSSPGRAGTTVRIRDSFFFSNCIDAKDVWDPFKTERCSFLGRLMIFSSVRPSRRRLTKPPSLSLSGMTTTITTTKKKSRERDQRLAELQEVSKSDGAVRERVLRAE